MASSIHGDADGSPPIVGILISMLASMAEDVLKDTWALVTGNNTAGKAAELSSQLTEISLRLSDNKTKFNTERNLQYTDHLIHKGIRDQSKTLRTWLKSRERADAFEDACLTGDSESAILIDLKTKAVRRCRQVLEVYELVYKLSLAHSTERMRTYDQQYGQAVMELIVLNSTLTSGEMASPKHQQQHLDTLIAVAEECLRRA